MARSATLGKPLSDRQLEILKVYALSPSIKEAASQLYISEKTVKNTLRDIYAQLGVVRGVNAVYKVFVEGEI